MISLELALAIACGLATTFIIFLLWAIGDLERRVVALEIENFTRPMGLEDSQC